MRHALVDIADKTMCSRCGNEVLRVDEVCPAITDGQIYQGKHTEKCQCSECKAMWADIDETLATVVIPPAPPETHH